MIFRIDGLPDSPQAHPATLEELVKVIELSSDPKTFALDTETTGLRTRQMELVGLSVTTSDEVTFYVPVGHQTLTAGNEEKGAVIGALSPFLGNRDQTIVYHNAPFDIVVLRDKGFPMRHKIVDTLSACNLYDSTRGRLGKSYSLKELSKELGVADQPTFAQTAKGGSFEDVEPEVAAVYAGLDSWCTLRIYRILNPKLKELGALDYFHEVEMMHQWSTVEMRFNGVRIDSARLEAEKEAAEKALEKLEELIHADPHVKMVFNVSSSPQLKTALFGMNVRKGRRAKDWLGESGSHETASAALVNLAKMRPDARELVKNIIKYRKIRGFISKYFDTFPARENPITKRVHPNMTSISIGGRYRCNFPNILGLPKKSCFSVDGVPHEWSIRSLIIPDDGWEIVTADFSQIDMRCIAHYSEDPLLKQYLDNGWDLHLAALAFLDPSRLEGLCEHRIKAEDVAGRKELTNPDGSKRWVVLKKDKSEVEISGESFNNLNAARTEMKAVNFGISYGMGAAGLQLKLNDVENVEDLDNLDSMKIWTLAECQGIVTKFFARYARMPVYKEDARKSAISRGQMLNVFGRALHVPIFSRLAFDPNRKVLLDLRGKNGEVRIEVGIRGLFADGLECLLFNAWEIDPPCRVLLNQEKPPSQREIKKWKEGHSDLRPQHPFFKLKSNEWEDLIRRTCAYCDPSDAQLGEFESRLPGCWVRRYSERDGILAAEAFDSVLADRYKARNRTPFESLPFVFVKHQIIELIQLDEEVGFINYGKLTEALRQLSSYEISSTSMDIAKVAMIRMREAIEERWPEEHSRPRLLFCVHDELVYEVKKNGKDVEEFTELLLKTMQMNPLLDGRFSAPILAEVNHGDNYELAKA
ncbi:MAG: hypothetical protein FJ279_01535 [Planctomycetes bacterium]|nr:hypothetical protein [Planctomycetota bacterium]MBM4236953.1 hypothetical protein [Euryarchaeota archaeon]